MSLCPIFIRLTSQCRNSEGQRPSFGCSSLEDRSSEKNGWPRNEFVTNGDGLQAKMWGLVA